MKNIISTFVTIVQLLCGMAIILFGFYKIDYMPSGSLVPFIILFGILLIFTGLSKLLLSPKYGVVVQILRYMWIIIAVGWTALVIIKLSMGGSRGTGVIIFSSFFIYLFCGSSLLILSKRISYVSIRGYSTVLQAIIISVLSILCWSLLNQHKIDAPFSLMKHLVISVIAGAVVGLTIALASKYRRWLVAIWLIAGVTLIAGSYITKSLIPGCRANVERAFEKAPNTKILTTWCVDQSLLERMIQKAENKNHRKSFDLILAQGASHPNPDCARLGISVANHDFDETTRLLDKGISPNCFSYNNRVTPLFKLYSNVKPDPQRDLKMLAILLDAGAQIAQDHLLIAMSTGNHYLLFEALKYVDPNFGFDHLSYTKQTNAIRNPLALAIKLCDFKAFQMLFEAGADISRKVALPAKMGRTIERYSINEYAIEQKRSIDYAVKKKPSRKFSLERQQNINAIIALLEEPGAVFRNRCGNSTKACYTQASVNNLRISNASDAKLVQKFPINTAVSVIEKKGAWLFVEVTGEKSYQGWLHRNLLADRPLTLDAALKQYKEKSASDPMRLQWIERAAALQPDNIEVLDKLIKTLLSLKENERASQVLASLNEAIANQKNTECFQETNAVKMIENEYFVSSSFVDHQLWGDRSALSCGEELIKRHQWRDRAEITLSKTYSGSIGLDFMTQNKSEIMALTSLAKCPICLISGPHYAFVKTADGYRWLPVELDFSLKYYQYFGCADTMLLELSFKTNIAGKQPVLFRMTKPKNKAGYLVDTTEELRDDINLVMVKFDQVPSISKLYKTYEKSMWTSSDSPSGPEEVLSKIELWVEFENGKKTMLMRRHGVGKYSYSSPEIKNIIILDANGDKEPDFMFDIDNGGKVLVLTASTEIIKTITLVTDEYSGVGGC